MKIFNSEMWLVLRIRKNTSLIIVKLWNFQNANIYKDSTRRMNVLVKILPLFSTTYLPFPLTKKVCNVVGSTTPQPGTSEMMNCFPKERKCRYFLSWPVVKSRLVLVRMCRGVRISKCLSCEWRLVVVSWIWSTAVSKNNVLGRSSASNDLITSVRRER